MYVCMYVGMNICIMQMCLCICMYVHENFYGKKKKKKKRFGEGEIMPWQCHYFFLTFFPLSSFFTSSLVGRSSKRLGSLSSGILFLSYFSIVHTTSPPPRKLFLKQLYKIPTLFSLFESKTPSATPARSVIFHPSDIEDTCIQYQYQYYS